MIKSYMITEEDKTKIQELITYEILGSWWCQYVWFEWGQNLASLYISKKVLKKYKRLKLWQGR